MDLVGPVALLAFLHGVFLTAMVFLATLSRYENGLFDEIVSKILRNGMNEKERALALIQMTHQLVKLRHEYFDGHSDIGTRDCLFHSSDVQLIEGKRQCGSYSHALGRLLQSVGVPIRMAQMKGRDIWGCHIFVETKIAGRFVVLDPTYNLAFENQQADLASFREIQKAWEFFKQQVPESYNPQYAYEGVRYTNWNKVPVILPVAKRGLRWIMGDRVETLSLRSWILNIYSAALIGGDWGLWLAEYCNVDGGMRNSRNAMGEAR